MYMCIDSSEMRMTQYPMLFIISIGVMITCSMEKRNSLFQKKLFYEAGELSFYIYLLHIPTMSICQNMLKSVGIILNENFECILYGVITIALACLAKRTFKLTIKKIDM